MPAPTAFNARLDSLETASLTIEPEIARAIQERFERAKSAPTEPPSADASRTEAETRGDEPADAVHNEGVCTLYTFNALRDAFFDNVSLRRQFTSRDFVPHANWSECIMKTLDLTFEAPADGTMVEASLRDVLEDALDADAAWAGDARRAELELRARLHAEAKSDAARAAADAVARGTALRTLVLPLSNAECDGGSCEKALTKKLDHKRCVFEALDVISIDNTETDGEALLYCNMAEAARRHVRAVEEGASDADAAAAGRVDASTEFGDAIARAQPRARASPGGAVRPRYLCEHARVVGFANATPARLLQGSYMVDAKGDEKRNNAEPLALMPLTLALGFYLLTFAADYGLAVVTKRSSDDDDATPIAGKAKIQPPAPAFIAVPSSVALRAAEDLAVANAAPWSDPLGLKFGLRLVGLENAAPGVRACVRVRVRVWYALVASEGALNEHTVWTAVGQRGTIEALRAAHTARAH